MNAVDGREFHRSLRGAWLVSRVIGRGIGSMAGTAWFTDSEPDVLRYREDGELRLAGGVVVHVSRSYDYRLDNGEVRVCFVESAARGRTLHLLRFPGDSDSAEDSHVCGADTYTGLYRLEAADRLTIAMTVLGPGKDHLITTRYDRVRTPGQCGREARVPGMGLCTP